jgi:hypothetical protein
MADYKYANKVNAIRYISIQENTIASRADWVGLIKNGTAYGLRHLVRIYSSYSTLILPFIFHLLIKKIL